MTDSGPENWEWLGQNLDERPKGQRQTREGLEIGELWEPTRRDLFIEEWLRIRTKTTNRTDFLLNRAQREYSRKSTEQNVVLKARQLGITTYVAARFFVQTITRRGTLSMQVTQDRESAEDIIPDRPAVLGEATG